MDPAVLVLAASNIGAVVVASWLEHRATVRKLGETQETTHNITLERIDQLEKLLAEKMK
jgi:hypothetical protein